MAVGFLDSDLKNDIVTINKDKNAFQVHFFNQNTLKFNSTSLFKVDPSHPGATIESVVIANDNLRFKSLFIVYKKAKFDSNSVLKVFRQTEFKHFEESTDSSINDLQLYKGIQPFLLDINGDMLTDIIYVEPP
mmetsp:Transcript_9006/g.15240  ORF Transcript_9006/g.15240 Transcript_9006/m.15240 type:complete len:133 (-) Transcript_9006:1734-2132(-)